MVTVAQQTLPFIRPDGKEKVTGLGRYTADLTFTGQLQAKLKFADHPHARIISIDVSKARALAGVFAVLTHEDVPDVLYGGMVKDRRLFAKEKVRWEGDVIAAVAALTDQIAARAISLIEVEYEVLPSQTDLYTNRKKQMALSFFYRPDLCRTHKRHCSLDSYAGNCALCFVISKNTFFAQK